MRTKRKNILRKVVAMTMLVALTIVPSLAVSAKTVEVKGYIEESMTQEEINNANSHFSVTNVTEVYDAENITGSYNDGLIVEGSTTIELLDDYAVFSVFELLDDKTYDLESKLPYSGGTMSLGIFENGEDKFITIDPKDLEEYYEKYPDNYPGSYDKGCRVTITEPGDYYVCVREFAAAGSAEAIITVKGNGTTEVKEQNNKIVAKSTASVVFVNDAEINFDAYNIDNNNYFKLRDLAKVVSGTQKQFNVTWDGENKVINLVSNEAYTAVGGELAEGDGQEKTAVVNSSKINKDGEEVALTAYTINNNNYFKLRDVAKVFDFAVNWDGETQTIKIDTANGYVEE